MNSPENKQEKKSYSSPTFLIYGTLREMTQNKPNTVGNADNPAPNNKTQ